MGSEQGRPYYNEIFAKSKKYSCDAEQTDYYNIWLTALSWINVNEKIGEACCGTGQFAKLAIKKGYNYLFGVDFSDTAISICNDKNKNNPIPFYVKDIFDENDNPIYDSIYDTLICFEGLEHIEKDILFISKIKPGTRLIFSVPNFDDIAHVRVFTNEKDVIDRYGEFLNFNNFYCHCFDNDSKIFLFDTVKK
ncbi:MAG: methyltransferase domain-containing protein [Bacteroidota bacterium]